MVSDLIYPIRDDVVAVHEDVVAESAVTDPGVRSAASVDSALTYVAEGYFGRAPSTL